MKYNAGKANLQDAFWNGVIRIAPVGMILQKEV